MDKQKVTCEYSGLRSLASILEEQEQKETPRFKSDKSIFNDEDSDRIIQMAWEDRTPFEAIEFQFGLKEKDVIEFMRKNSLPSSFRMWRKRMKSRKTKHMALRDSQTIRFKCNRQRSTGNKITKR
jgi:uncharacterized protein (TIGR03643 family)